MGVGASIIPFKAASSSRLKKPCRKIQPEPRGQVFAVSLAMLRDTGQMVCGIPRVLRDMVEFLEEHALQQKGLFRLSGSVAKTGLLRARCDRGEPVDFSAGGMDSHSVASLLKLFLRELPTAIIPSTQCAVMVKCFRECTDEPALNHLLKEQLTSLPEDNYNVLSYLCHFLLKVASHSQVNHMSVENLATIFGPCLFHVPQGPSMLKEQSLCNAVLCHLLRNCPFLLSGRLAMPSPTPPPLLSVHQEKNAIDHIPSIWPCACENAAEALVFSTAETQILNTGVIFLPGSSEMQVSNMAEAQLSGTAETSQLLPGTTEMQVLNTTETLLPDTAETQLPGSAETVLLDTAETHVLNTAGTCVFHTVETLLPDTDDTQLPGTAETQVFNTAEIQLQGTAETVLLDTAETEVLNTAWTPVLNTVETLLPDAADMQLPRTAETHEYGTADPPNQVATAAVPSGDKDEKGENMQGAERI